MTTKLGKFDRAKFNALVNVRSVALKALRETLYNRGFTEVSTSSLVNVAGSCENPNASFSLNYYGKEAHLSQSAQIQLEALVMRLKKGFFTVNNSFREEHFDDPEAKGRRLSEFTLIEPEKPFLNHTPEEALNEIIIEQELIIKYAIKQVLRNCEEELKLFGADIFFLKKVINTKFNKITHKGAIKILNKKGFSLDEDADLGILEERKVLEHFNNIPTFVTNYPTKIKFFNMKRMYYKERVFSVDLLMPRLGETTGGAVREENGEIIKKSLIDSNIGKFLKKKGIDPILPFQEYFSLFDEEDPILRGGFGIGFERFIGFLLDSNDIIETISYKTMQPS